MARGRPVNHGQQLEKRRIKAAVKRDMMEFGIESRTELAARHGRSRGTITEYIKEILEEAREDYEVASQHITAKVSARWDSVFRRAAVEFERSKKNGETRRISYDRQKCKDCGGTGFAEGDKESGEWCELCDGEGFKLIENVTIESKGQCGDPQYLRIMIDCTREQCKLSGLYPMGVNDRRGGVNVNVLSNHVDLSGVSNDKLLEVLAGIQHAMLPSDPGDDGGVIDV